MATRLTRRGKFLAIVAGLLALVALVIVGINMFDEDDSKSTKHGQTQSNPQRNDIPPLSSQRASELERLLSSNRAREQAAAWPVPMRDDVTAAIKDQVSYKFLHDTFNNKVGGKESVSGAVSATADGSPCTISLVYIENDNTTKPDGTWFVWQIEVN